MIKKESKTKNANFASITDGTTARKFAAVKIIDDVSEKQSKGQITKLHLNKDIYLDLSIELEIEDLYYFNKTFAILRIAS